MDKRSFRTRTVAVALLAGAALLVPAAGAQARTKSTVRGTVVHRNARAGSFVVATGKGRLFAIHAASSPAVGSKVRVGLRRLANGTYSATSIAVGKHHAKTRVHGRVSHVSASGTSFTVSAAGVSLLVDTRPGGKAPAVGRIVTVSGVAGDESEGGEDEGQVQEEDLQEEGEDTNGFVIEGTILEVEPLARTLVVSADDNQESGETVTVHVPPSLDMSLFSVNQQVELNVKPLEGGGYELLGSADDEGEQGAEGNEDDRGELGEAGNEGENEQ